MYFVLPQVLFWRPGYLTEVRPDTVTSATSFDAALLAHLAAARVHQLRRLLFFDRYLLGSGIFNLAKLGKFLQLLAEL